MRYADAPRPASSSTQPRTGFLMISANATVRPPKSALIPHADSLARDTPCRSACPRFRFVPDPQRPGPCELIPYLRLLWDAGALRGFRKDFGNRTEELGNCHDVSAALAADLLAHGLDAGWRYVSADYSPGSGHTWFECDGWVVDASYRSLERLIVVQPAKHYRKAVDRHGWTMTWDLTLREVVECDDEAETGGV